MLRLGILGSTRGTHLLALLEAIQQGILSATIEVVISNKSQALILERAKAHHLSAEFIEPTGLTRDAYDEQVSHVLEHHHIDLIVLIGYMRILSAPFVQTWENKIINVHPSLLPAFAGMMDLDVHRAVLASGIHETGCTVHYVTEKVDAGPILLQEKCLVKANDTPEMLKDRVQQLEARALVNAINRIALT